MGEFQRRQGLRTGKHGLLLAFASTPFGLFQFADTGEQRSLHALQGGEHDGQLIPVLELQGFGILARRHVFRILADLAQRLGDSHLEDIDIGNRAGPQGQQGKKHCPDHLDKRRLLLAHLLQKAAVLHFAQSLRAEKNLLRFTVQIDPVYPALRAFQIKPVPVPQGRPAIAHSHVHGGIKQTVEVPALGKKRLNLPLQTSRHIEIAGNMLKGSLEPGGVLHLVDAILIQHLPLGITLWIARKNKGVGFFVTLAGIGFHIHQEGIKPVIVFEYPAALIKATPQRDQAKPKQQKKQQLREVGSFDDGSDAHASCSRRQRTVPFVKLEPGQAGTPARLPDGLIP